MLKRIIISIMLVALLALPGEALAQSDAITQAYNQGSALYKAGRYREAIQYWRKVLQLGERKFGANHPTTAIFINNLAFLYSAQGLYGEAEPLYKRALAISIKVLGPDHPDVASGLNNLGLLYYNQGRYDEAKPLYIRALAIREKVLGPGHADVGQSLNNLAELYRSQGQYRTAEILYKRALVIWKKALGPDHLQVAIGLNNLAELYRTQGQYRDAEPVLKNSLEILQKVLGPNHPKVAQSINILALLYYNQGRYSDAEPLYKRSLAIWKEILGPEHPKVATGLNNLAELYRVQGRYADAKPLFQRSLVIMEKALGSRNPKVAQTLNNLALLDVAQGRYGDAELQYKRAIGIWQKSLGPDHPQVATGLNNLATLYRAQEQYDEAGSLYKRSLSIVEKAFGPFHPKVALALNNLAVFYNSQGRTLEALEYSRQASAIHRTRAAQAAMQRSGGGLSEQRQVGYVFVNQIALLWDASTIKPAAQALLHAEAFEAGQLARATSTAAAVAGMGARFAAKDDALASLVRRRQDAGRLWQQIDRKLIKAASLAAAKRDAKGEIRLRTELSELDGQLKQLDQRLALEFPQYAELTSPQPMKLKAVQELLGSREALLSYVVGQQQTFLWVIRRETSAMYSLAIGAKELSQTVRELRSGLDLTGIDDISDIPPFETALAYKLYTKLFAPAVERLEGVTHVFVVADGALQSLPLGVLVTEKPISTVSNFEDYRKVAWLTRRYALSTLPSVSSLRSLRKFAKKSKAQQPFLGIGNPILEGNPAQVRGVNLASLFTSQGIADVNAVRSLLPPLPDTADELSAMAKSLGAGIKSLMLGGEATERAVRETDLTRYKVLAFATHGLVAGDLKGLSEPALVLTPPKIGSETDDGLLTASEVALLKLDAEWVILSACNTAASDGTPGAEGLSGLAKAFFFAGARTLLVSHWPVNSKVAVRLTTNMLSRTADNPSLGRAQALKRSMLALIADKKAPSYYAHPGFWAPFVVVGEGGAAL
jgi:CHAT domain-containing protein/Tfp pilus assembly protein PilF